MMIAHPSMMLAHHSALLLNHLPVRLQQNRPLFRTKINLGQQMHVDLTQSAMLMLLQSLTERVNNLSVNQAYHQQSTSVSQSSNLHKIQLFYANPHTIETVKCPKLEKMDPISFINWKNKVEQWATSKMVWGIITDTHEVSLQKAKEFCAPFNLPEENVKTLLKHLQTVVWSSLLEAVSPILGTTLGTSIKHDENQATEHGQTVFWYMNPNYLWLDLEKRFGRKAGVGTIQLFKELTQLKMDPAEHPTDFRKRFNTLLLHWQEVTGSALQSDVQLAAFVEALPSKKYENVVTNILAAHAKPTVDLIHEAMIRQTNFAPTKSVSHSGIHSQMAALVDSDPDAAMAFIQQHQQNKKGRNNSKRAKQPAKQKSSTTKSEIGFYTAEELSAHSQETPDENSDSDQIAFIFMEGAGDTASPVNWHDPSINRHDRHDRLIKRHDPSIRRHDLSINRHDRDGPLIKRHDLSIESIERHDPSVNRHDPSVSFLFMEEAVDTALLVQQSDPYFDLDAVIWHDQSSSSDANNRIPAPGGAELLSVNSSPTRSSPPFLHQSLATRGHEFILDTGATKHIIFNKNLLFNVREIEPFVLFTATGQHTQVKYQGTVRVSDKVVINNVCFIPRATHNLISLSVLLDGGAEISHMSADRITIAKRSGSIQAAMHFLRENGLVCGSSN